MVMENALQVIVESTGKRVQFSGCFTTFTPSIKINKTIEKKIDEPSGFRKQRRSTT
jgi:hypothetical protein